MSKAFEAAGPDFDASYEPRQPRNSPRGDEPTDSAEYEVPVTVAVDVEETSEGYSLFMDVPGLQKSDVKVALVYYYFMGLGVNSVCGGITTFKPRCARL